MKTCCFDLSYVTNALGLVLPVPVTGPLLCKLGSLTFELPKMSKPLASGQNQALTCSKAGKH